MIVSSLRIVKSFVFSQRSLHVNASIKPKQSLLFKRQYHGTGTFQINSRGPRFAPNLDYEADDQFDGADFEDKLDGKGAAENQDLDSAELPEEEEDEEVASDAVKGQDLPHFRLADSVSPKDNFNWGKVKQDIFGDFGKREDIHEVKNVSFVPKALPDEHTVPKDYDVYQDDSNLEYKNPIGAWIPPVMPRPLPKIHYNGSVTAMGRRKRAVANVTLAPGSGNLIVNKRHWMYYFKDWPVRCVVIEPLLLTETLNQWDVMIDVHGGGTKGQAGAIRLAISRALVRYDPELKPPLSGSKLLTRDPREVERKKVGRHKARRAFQWVKR